MPYVRRRGNQLALVHGVRDPETKKVEQQILFTIYSKGEALEVLGRGSPDGARRFEALVQEQYADLRFDWKKIRGAIEAELGFLPDLYPYREERLKRRFKESLLTFARELLVADPQVLPGAATLVEEHAGALRYVTDLIAWRLAECTKKSEPLATDNPFHWRFALQRCEVPMEAEEDAAALYEKGRLDEAEAAFLVLTDCFPGYAEGWNYLGLIAEERGKLEEAIACFEKTAELGRKLFPKKIARRRYWSELATRPYIRGLRNLAGALNRAGRCEDSLRVCDRLEKECDETHAAAAFRAAAYLNLGLWQLAAEAAGVVLGLWPEENLLVAFARFELGEHEEALAAFLHAALNQPRAVRLVVGDRSSKPKTGLEAMDHNAGVALFHATAIYRGRSSRALKWFRGVLHDPRVAALLDEADRLEKQRHEEHRSGRREAFDRLQEMHKYAFAREKALALSDLGAAASDEAPGRRRTPSAPPDHMLN